MFCNKCGLEVLNNSKFCYKCGNEIETEDNSVTDQNSTEDIESNTGNIDNNTGNIDNNTNDKVRNEYTQSSNEYTSNSNEYTPSSTENEINNGKVNLNKPELNDNYENISQNNQNDENIYQNNLSNENIYQNNQNAYSQSQQQPYNNGYTSINNANSPISNTPPPYTTQTGYNNQGYNTTSSMYSNQYQYAKSSDNLGVISLCIGIATMICLQPFGIVAIIIGIVKLKKKDGQDKGLCIAGIITGAIGVLLTILCILLIIIGACFDDTTSKHKYSTYGNSSYYDDSNYDDSSYDDSSLDL